MVFVFHAARPGLPGGFLGVDIFFVLSGFLITSILMSRIDATGSLGLGDFYARRFRRLMPAAILLVVGVALYEATWGSALELATRRREALTTLFYVANWNLISQSDDYFLEASVRSPLRHTWSLAVEEQFYLVWPLVLLALVRLVRRPALRSTVVLLCVAASAAAMAIRYDPTYVTRAYYGTDARIHQPLVGSALAIVLHAWGLPQWAHRFGRLMAIAALACLVAASAIVEGDDAFYYRGGSLALALVCAVLIAGLEAAPASPVGWLLSRKPFVELGRISYGFYLWHWPVIVWISAPDEAGFLDRRLVNVAQLALTLGLALASFHIVERPIREGRRLFGRFGTTPTLAIGAVSLLAASVVSLGLLQAPTSADGDIARAALADRSVQECPEDPQPCVKVVGRGTDPLTVALVGDSTAQSYDPALQALARRLGFRYVHAAVGGCPIGHRLIASGIEGELHKPSNFTCFEESPAIYDTIVGQWDPDIILATSLNEANQHIKGGSGSEVVVAGSPEYVRDTRLALDRAVEQLTTGGAQLVFIELLPRGVGVDCLEVGGPNDPSCTVGVDPNTTISIVNRIFHQIARTTPGVETVSVTDRVCPRDLCPLLIEGVVARYDGTHYTATMSRRLAPVLQRRLARVGVELS